MSDIQNNITERLKILYSLAEIKENGYSITVPIPQEQRCQYCNKLFEIMGIMNPLNKNIFHFVVDKKCSCEGTLEEQNRLEYERNKKSICFANTCHSLRSDEYRKLNLVTSEKSCDFSYVIRKHKRNTKKLENVN